jgi:AcrR family transcriptional regulator
MPLSRRGEKLQGEAKERERRPDGEGVPVVDVGGLSTLGGTRVERRDVTRNRRVILDAAREAFAQRGVSRVCMEEVARWAGVGKGTLYRHFPNKGLLCQALLDEPAREVQAEVLAVVGAGGVSPLVRLDAVLERLARFTDANLELLYGGHEMLKGEDRLAFFDHPARTWQRGTVAGLMRMAQEEGELGAHYDPAYLADALLATLDPDLFYYQRRVRGLPVERIISGLRSLVPGPT